MIESASASATRDFLTYIVMGRLLASDVTVAQGPAANAMRYVLMGSVSANRWSVLAPWLETVEPASGLFATTRHSFGATSRRVTFAFRSGWSKHGNSWFASAGTRSVYKYSDP